MSTTASRAAPRGGRDAGPPWYHWSNLLPLYLYVTALVLALLHLPNNVWNPRTHQVLAGLGLIGLWRYGWWAVHLVRAKWFTHRVYPRERAAADALWAGGWRPRHLYFMMTTFKEAPDITRAVLRSIVDECRRARLPAQLFVGTGSHFDEAVIDGYLQEIDGHRWLEVVLVRQSAPGKRMAIGAALRAMARRGIRGDDPVVFMDGDAILERDCLSRCLSLMGLDPQLRALTTNEKALVRGPDWIQDWLDLRFAQRDLGMRSHALSRKVLTLTGRLSVFRAGDVTRRDFIRLIESDHLDHWLWGRFRFLSGDDKSTWYWLLQRGAAMTYVPDAMVYTIEKVGDSAFDYVKQTLLRWSGNMMRNGARAMALGPRRVGPFIWWCIVDQRIAVWTSLVSPAVALSTALFVTPTFLVVYVLWIATTRFITSLVLFGHGRRVNLRFPFLLYAGQLLNASLKVYIWFRLPKQRWKNRGNQRARQGQGGVWALRNAAAFLLTTLAVAALLFFVMTYVGPLRLPDQHVWHDLLH